MAGVPPPPRPDPAAPKHGSIEYTKAWFRRLPPPGKVAVALLGAFAVLLILAGLLSGVQSGIGLDGGGLHSVEYTVSVYRGNRASVTYNTNGQDTSQDTNAQTPWSYTTSMSTGDVYYVSAQNKGGGKIVCEVAVDGTVVHTNASIGAFAICTASGSV